MIHIDGIESGILESGDCAEGVFGLQHRIWPIRLGVYVCPKLSSRRTLMRSRRWRCVCRLATSNLVAVKCLTAALICPISVAAFLTGKHQNVGFELGGGLVHLVECFFEVIANVEVVGQHCWDFRREGAEERAFADVGIEPKQHVVSLDAVFESDIERANQYVDCADDSGAVFRIGSVEAQSAFRFGCVEYEFGVQDCTFNAFYASCGASCRIIAVTASISSMASSSILINLAAPTFVATCLNVACGLCGEQVA